MNMSNLELLGEKVKALGFDLKWSAKYPKQVELRKTYGSAGMRKPEFGQMLVIVSDGPYTYNRASPEGDTWGRKTGDPVRISLNGPAAMSFEDVDNLAKAVDTAKYFLTLKE